VRWACASIADDAAWPPEETAGEEIGEVGGVKIFRRPGVVWWETKAAIDVDGAPDAYHRDDRKGRDYLANAGRPGNWWGIVTNTDHIAGQSGKGTPLVQGETAPAFSDATRGYYVSSTALADNPELPISDVRRYCNPDEVPGIVIPAHFPVKVRMGQACRVTYRGIPAPAIVFDLGGPTVIGEIGTLLAQQLGIQNDPKHGGVPSGVRYELLI
jgi:hypothetical protein